MNTNCTIKTKTIKIRVKRRPAVEFKIVDDEMPTVDDEMPTVDDEMPTFRVVDEEEYIIPTVTPRTLFNAVIDELINGDKIKRMVDLFIKQKIEYIERKVLNNKGVHDGTYLKLLTSQRKYTTPNRAYYSNNESTQWRCVYGEFRTSQLDEKIIHATGGKPTATYLYELFNGLKDRPRNWSKPYEKCGIEVVGMVRILSKTGDKYCVKGITKTPRWLKACEQNSDGSNRGGQPTSRTRKDLQQACRDNKIRGFIHWDKLELIKHLMKC